MMDQMIFNWAVAAAGALGGWILKVIWDAIVELKKDIQRMDTKMHEDFVRRDDFKDAEYASLCSHMTRANPDMSCNIPAPGCNDFSEDVFFCSACPQTNR